MPSPEKLKKFIKDKDFPPWYRELSDRQMNAADDLLNSIRDDSNQGTTHRIRRSLERIGISPLVRGKHLKITMRMSQGNDLGFLWFLLELFYVKSVQSIHTSGSVFTVNQQLIMSTICHLDMITTLRELDKILPQQGKLKDISNNISKEILKFTKSRKTQIDYINPYLEPLYKPKLPIKKCITLLEPKVKITPYERYADPVYIVANEANRWFADINLDLSQAAGKTLSSVEVVRGLLDDQIDKMELGDGDSIKLKNFVSLCARHEKSERRRLNKLLVDARDRCIRYFFKDYKTNREIVLRRNFEAQLKIELDKVQENFRELCGKFDTEYWLRFIIHEIVDNIKEIDEDDKKSNTDDGDNVIVENEEKLADENVSEHKSIFNFGHCGKPKLREKFFEAPKEHTPFKFDYTRIFNTNDIVSHDDPKRHIRTSVDAALDLDKYLNEDEAITDWLRLTWVNEVKISNDNYRKVKKETEKEEILEKNKDKYFDPKDVKLMRDLLKSALHDMSKNPKFVLASMPDVYKLPLLNNWIQARYGLIIKEKTRMKALRKTHDILELMDKATMKIKIPTLDEISKHRHLNYNVHDMVIDKIETVIQSFYLRTKIRILEDVRIYWAALEPYHCTNGPPRETFYAYMPSKVHDILPFRPWQTFQYRDFKRSRDELNKKSRSIDP